MQNGKIQIVLGSATSSDELQLSFRVENHAMAKKYVALLNEFNSSNVPIDRLNSYWNFHLDPQWINTLTKELQFRLDQLKGEPEIEMRFTVDSNVQQEELNIIHAAFEKYLLLVNSGTLVAKDWRSATEALLQINLLVHRIENFHLLQRSIARGQRNSLPCSFGFRFENDRFFQLEETDFDCFEPGCEFGDFFCGYNTTGKNFIHCLNDKDLELVRTGGVRPQRSFSTEGFLHFGPRALGNDVLNRLRKWWIENEIESFGYPFNEKKNAFGLIRIGRLIEPEEFRGKSQWEKVLIIDKFDGVKSCRHIAG